MSLNEETRQILAELLAASECGDIEELNIKATVKTGGDKEKRTHYRWAIADKEK